MIKPAVLALIAIGATSCTPYPTKQQTTSETESSTKPPIKEQAKQTTSCAGDIEPQPWMNNLAPIEDKQLLNKALGEPLKGGLCNGQTYKVVEDFVIYRAWNATNPHSRLGSWWASAMPKGLTSQYREDYEICYQWSPLDRAVQCTITKGTNVVVGTGQSAMCSEYLTYETSPKLQIYIDNASEQAVVNCKDFVLTFHWLETQ